MTSKKIELPTCPFAQCTKFRVDFMKMTRTAAKELSRSGYTCKGKVADAFRKEGGEYPLGRDLAHIHSWLS